MAVFGQREAVSGSGGSRDGQQRKLRGQLGKWREGVGETVKMSGRSGVGEWGKR